MTDISFVISAIHEYPQLPLTLFGVQNEMVDENYTWEIIVVENREKDPYTDKFLHWFRVIRNQGKLKYVFEPRTNNGVAKNTGVKKASGRYVVFTDAHAILGKNTVPKLVETVEAHDPCMVHGCTVWSHYDPYYAGCHYKMFGSSITFTSHGHGSYQPCKHHREPYKVVGGTLAYTIFDREEYLELHGYHEEWRFRPSPETYIPLKYWMFDTEVWLDPRCFHFHSLYPRNYGGTPDYEVNGHRLTWNDHTIRNAMIALYTLGGKIWLDKVYETWLKKGGKPEILDLIKRDAMEKSEPEREWIANNAERTLDETLEWLRNNKIAGLGGEI